MELIYNGNSKQSGVYKITNKVNGKIYIGSAKCFQVRASQHLSSLEKQKHQNKHLQASFNKHGSGAFLFEVLEVVEGERLARTQVEQKYLNEQIELENWENCFNFAKKTVRKQGPWSRTPDETSKKISAAQKRIWLDPEYRKNLGNFSKQRWADPEMRKVIMDHKNATQQTDEYRQKQSETSKENWSNPVIKQNRINGLKEATNTKECKEKHKKIMNERWSNASYKEKLSLYAKKQWENLDYKNTMIEKLINSRSKEWTFLNDKKEIVVIKNLKQYCKENSISYYKLRLLGIGKIKEYNGWALI